MLITFLSLNHYHHQKHEFSCNFCRNIVVVTIVVKSVVVAVFVVRRIVFYEIFSHYFAIIISREKNWLLLLVSGQEEILVDQLELDGLYNTNFPDIMDYGAYNIKTLKSRFTGLNIFYINCRQYCHGNNNVKITLQVGFS